MKRIGILLVLLIIVLIGCQDPCRYVYPEFREVGCLSPCKMIYGICLYKNGVNLIDANKIDTSKMEVKSIDMISSLDFKIVNTELGKAIRILNPCKDSKETCTSELYYGCYWEVVIMYKDSSFINDTIRIERREVYYSSYPSKSKCFGDVDVYHFNCYLYKIQSDTTIILSDSTMFSKPVILEK